MICPKPSIPLKIPLDRLFTRRLTDLSYFGIADSTISGSPSITPIGLNMPVMAIPKPIMSTLSGNLSNYEGPTHKKPIAAPQAARIIMTLFSIERGKTVTASIADTM